MNKLNALIFAFALALASPLSLAADDPHGGAGGPLPPHPGMGGPQGGPPPGMMEGHGGMRPHMGMMREHGGREHRSYADVVLKFADELKLSDEQIGKITRVNQANQQQMDELGPKMHETIRATHETFLDPASDEASIRKVAKAHTDAFEQLLELNLKARKEINAVLTAEQLKLLQGKKLPPAPPPPPMR